MDKKEEDCLARVASSCIIYKGSILKTGRFLTEDTPKEGLQLIRSLRIDSVQ